MAAPTLTDRLFDDSFAGPLDPFEIFPDWLASARQSEINDANAMAVASVDETGLPDARMVLLNGFDRRGFVFFTNFDSAKGGQLLAQPKAALLFHWKSLRRQVRVRGLVAVVTPEEADAYFGQRPRRSQIASSASDQSRPLASRQVLIERVDRLAETLGEGPVPRPPHWSGFRVVPETIEFWKDGEARLHDRVRFTRDGDGWSRQRLYP